MSQRSQDKKNFLQEFLRGALGAVMSKSLVSPIELIKLRLQCQNEMIRAGTLLERYKGIRDCFMRVLREEGVKAFWKGNLTNILSYFPSQALSFALKDSVKKKIGRDKKDGYAAWFASIICSGGIAGSISLFFVYPLDYARTRLTNDLKSARFGGQKQFRGITDVFQKTLASDGIRGLYRGAVISCSGIFVYRGIYFGLYDLLKYLHPSNNFLFSFLLGWGVTMMAGICSYPIDTIRRRMMMTSCQSTKYSGSIDCARKIVTTEGFQFLFKGYLVNVYRGVAAASALACYDLFK